MDWTHVERGYEHLPKELSLRNGGHSFPLRIFRTTTYANKHGMQFSFLDRGAKENQMVTKYCSKPTLKMLEYLPHVLFSYNGLVVLESSPKSSYFIIYNPITQEEIILKKLYSTGYICAIYFHSSTGEYRTMYAYRNCKAITHCWSYLIAGQSWNHWFHLRIATYAPPLKGGPVNINGFVYWMIDSKVIDYTAAIPPLCTASIIAFDTETEEIRVMAHPGTTCSSCRDAQPYMNLLNVENSLVYARVYLKLIRIWVLEDSTKWLWAKRYDINLDFDVQQYPSVTNPHYYIKLFYIPDGQLLIYWDGVGLFQYHLELKTFRKIDVIINGRDLMSYHRESLCWTSYTKSFESYIKTV
ncbi:uncharacterized protein LOC126674292 [Mercurialis annua]|uniref:uncharacterized protein LOC126674292 n=1 Tax=Mercurialis annua TaxID=3986 RepID=UPI002160AB84|nr:uncharacterized protein LOC126674292 [Mercurialis annua]